MWLSGGASDEFHAPNMTDDISCRPDPVGFHHPNELSLKFRFSIEPFTFRQDIRSTRGDFRGLGD
jgi:hypothetical protein